MRENLMVRVLMIAFGLGSLLDFFMVTFGMIAILQVGSVIGYITCVVTSFVLLCLRLCTKTIHVRDRILYYFILFAIVAAIVLDFFAISNAVIVHIIKKLPLGAVTVVNWAELWNSTTASILFVSAALVLFLTSSPMALSYLLNEQFRNDEEGDVPPPLGKRGRKED